jgi:hypothetical protein
VYIGGDLITTGNTINVVADTLNITDPNITLASGAANSTVADGAGITIDGADATMTYVASGDKFVFNKSVDITGTTTLTPTGDSPALVIGYDGTQGHASEIRFYNGYTQTFTIGLNDLYGNRDLWITETSSGASTDTKNPRYRFRGDGDGIFSFTDEAGDDFKVQLNAGGDSYLNGGNVGIGIDTPESKLTVGTNAITTLKPTAVFVDATNGGSVTIRGRSPTLAFDKTGTDASARILLDGGALQFRDNDLDATNPNQTNTPTSNLLMVLSHDGKLGVGNFGSVYAPYYHDPDFQLHVKGDGDVKIEDDNGGSAHLRLTSSTSGTPDSEWKVKVYGGGDEFHIDHDYTAGGVSVGTTAFKISGATHSLYNDNNQPTIRPCLNLDFANSKQLDPRITFYRDSIATYYDCKGVLRYANVNEPRFDHDPVTGESKGLLIEEARTNAMPYSSHPGLWDPTYNTSTAIYQSEVLAPDGTMSSANFISTTSSSSDHVLQGPVSSITSGTVTASLYVKSLGVTVFRFAVANTGINSRFRATFNLNTLAITTTGQDGSGFTYSSSSITPVGNDWYKITLTGSVNVACRFYIVTQDTNEAFTWSQTSGTGLTVWGGQIESGAFATSFVPSDTRFTSRSSVATYYDETGILRTAPANSPRYGYKYDGRKWVETGLILENAATNKITWSEDFNPTWTTGVGTKPTRDKGYSAPDGSNNATLITGAGTTYSRLLWPNISINANGGHASFSIYVKTNNHPILQFATTAANYSACSFTFATETISNSSPGAYNAELNYEKLPDGWYRLTYSLTNSSGSNITNEYIGLMFDSASTSLYAWGAQYETTDRFATSYIATNGSMVTRSADVASSVAYTRQQDIAYLDNIEDWNSEEEGTFYTEHQVPYDIEDLSTNRRIIERHNFVGDNVTSIIHNGGTDQLNAGMYNNSGWQSLMGVTSPYGVVDKNNVYKTAFAYAENDFALSVQGSPIATDTSGTLTYNNTRLQLGNNSAESAALCGHLKAVRFYPERLTNNELIALTENN